MHYLQAETSIGLNNAREHPMKARCEITAWEIIVIIIIIIIIIII